MIMHGPVIQGSVHNSAENIPVLPWPTYSPDMSPIEHVWDATISNNFAQALKRRGPTFHRPQSTTIVLLLKKWHTILSNP